MPRTAFCWVTLFLLLFVAPATGLEVLQPKDAQRFSRDSGWLIVRCERMPDVKLNGGAVSLRSEVEDVFHFRLQGLHGEGATLTVQDGGDEVVLTIYGDAGETVPAFHAEKADACWNCHGSSDQACAECHRWEGKKHSPLLAEGCGRCHVEPSFLPVDTQAMCARCHTEYSSGKHGRMRHAVRSERDPLRPSRAMDCTSCHDPHSPSCLSCLGRPQLRSWCIRCHGGL